METLYFYEKSLKIIRKRQEDIRETICYGPVNDFESFKELRAKLQEQENRGPGGSSNTGGDNAIFPFWNIPENSTSVLRFLPDGDSSNTYFWRERQMIRLEFAGIKGQEHESR